MDIFTQGVAWLLINFFANFSMVLLMKVLLGKKNAYLITVEKEDIRELRNRVRHFFSHSSKVDLQK